jgi:hypothetical protein
LAHRYFKECRRSMEERGEGAGGEEEGEGAAKAD